MPVSRMLLAGMLGLGLASCTNAAAGALEHRAAGRSMGGRRAVDRTLVAGTLIEAMIDRSGEPRTATVTADVSNARHWIVIPTGSQLTLKIARGRSTNLVLEVTSVTVRGRVTPVSATIELTPAVAAGKRILFVLPEGFTAATRPEAIP